MACPANSLIYILIDVSLSMCNGNIYIATYQPVAATGLCMSSPGTTNLLHSKMVYYRHPTFSTMSHSLSDGGG